MPYDVIFIPYIVHCQAFLSIYGTIICNLYDNYGNQDKISRLSTA